MLESEEINTTEQSALALRERAAKKNCEIHYFNEKPEGIAENPEKQPAAGQLWCWAGRGAAPRCPPCRPYSRGCQIPTRAGNKILPSSDANTWFL